MVTQPWREILRVSDFGAMHIGALQNNCSTILAYFCIKLQPGYEHRNQNFLLMGFSHDRRAAAADEKIQVSPLVGLFYMLNVEF